MSGANNLVVLIGVFIRPMIGWILIISFIGKIIDIKGTRRAIGAYSPELGDVLKVRLALMLPLFEAILGVVLIGQLLPVISSVGVFVLLSTFLVGVLRVLRRGTRMNCHCFGALTREPVSKWTVVRLAVLLSLTIVLVAIDWFATFTRDTYLGGASADVSALRPVAALTTSLIALCVVILGQVTAMLQSQHQVQRSQSDAFGR